mmetsp:Transcript_5202/g.15017  ORF Transcript_5202/g.15017 Transcript_5202/m.15017 type:complete len:384 (-) Transcript_5202:403-1554(-)
MTQHRTAAVALALGAHALLGGISRAFAFSVGDFRSTRGGAARTGNCLPSTTAGTTARWARRRVLTLDEEAVDVSGIADRRFDPLGEASDGSWDAVHERRGGTGESRGRRNGASVPSHAGGLAALAALPLLTVNPDDAVAAPAITIPSKLTTNFDPENFKPICSASDNFYRLLQGTTEAVVGPEAFREYGPLIAGGLLRIRLELCVVESFFSEAVGPFIRENGLSWILPLHETVETFIAGTIFALATTFIMVGSTKLISVIAVYGDAFVGVPCRLFGTFFFDRAMGKPVTLDIGLGPWKTRVIGPPEEEEAEKVAKGLGDVPAGKIPVVLVSGAVKYLGEGSKIVRETIEALDLFVGRYLVVIATGYIGFKFIHFKIFTDFPPF